MSKNRVRSKGKLIVHIILAISYIIRIYQIFKYFLYSIKIKTGNNLLYKKRVSIFKRCLLQ